MTHLLTRLKIRTRLMLVCVTLMVPISLLGYQLNSKLQEAIDFSVQERKGADFVKPLVILLNSVADHEIAKLGQSFGYTGAQQELNSNGADIDQLMAELTALDAKYGNDLNFTPEALKQVGKPEITVANLKEKWSAVKEQKNYDSAAYTSIMNDLVAMIAHTGDASNLILDGDLDSYYLVDAIFNSFPPLLDLLAKIKDSGLQSLHENAGTLSSDVADDLRFKSMMISDQLTPKAINSINTSLQNDNNHQGSLDSFQSAFPDKVAAFKAQSADAVKIIEELINNGTMTPDAFVTEMDKFHDLAGELPTDLIEELKKMLDIRIESLVEKRNLLGIKCGIALIISIILFFVIASSISRPIQLITEKMKLLADGDTAIEVPSTDDRSEIGAIAKAVLVFKEHMIQSEEMRAEQEALKLRAAEEKRQSMHAMATNFESSIKTVVTSVSASAEQMRGNAERLSTLASETKANSATVSSSATTAAQTATQVAAAAEELTAAIGEISAQVQKSSAVANQASSQAESINQSMHMLVEKSNRVGEVIQFITNIASQINLLALNATIESARAGEAGRGFAVVASEVKNLANQTAKATEEIVQQVQSMQEATKGAVHSVGEIIAIISEISQNTAGVAAAVEEQSAATNEISRNIAHTAQGTSEISRSIGAVESGADETGNSSRQVLDSAKALSGQAATLSQKVDEFLRTVRAS